MKQECLVDDSDAKKRRETASVTDASISEVETCEVIAILAGRLKKEKLKIDVSSLDIGTAP